MIGEEGVPRAHRGIRFESPGGDGDQRTWLAPVLLDGADDFGDHEVDGFGCIGQGDDGAERVAVGELQVQASLLEYVGHQLSVGSGACQGQHDLGGIVHQQCR